MSPKLITVPILIFYFAILFGCFLAAHFSKSAGGESGISSIVSLSPAITQSLVALGLEKKISGVSRFCQLPDGAEPRRIVGDMINVNLDALKILKPDLVILPANMKFIAERLRSLGMKILAFDSSSPSGLLSSIFRLGQATGAQETAGRLRASFEEDVLALRKKVFNPAPRVLFALLALGECGFAGHEASFIGQDNFFSKLIEIAGGKNAYDGDLPYPAISVEGILALEPDLLVISAPMCAEKRAVARSWASIWRGTDKTPKILVLNQPQDTVPGPLAIKTAQKIQGAIGR